MSLEDISLEQRDELALLAKQLAENPSTRKDFLRMTKKVKPDLPIPELEMQDYTEKKMSDMENRLLVSENKLREKDAREELNRRRQSLITKGLARDDADVEQIEKIMLSKNISNHETAAEYFDWMKQAAEPTPSGYNPSEAESFFSWYDSIEGYETKILISGNHDRIMENDPSWASGVLTGYKTIEYLQDEELTLYFDGPNGDFPEDNIHIWGSPWQPNFNNWAFNLERGEEIKRKWNLIPQNTDILITHGPPFSKLDFVNRGGNVGCEDLLSKVNSIKPKIHVFGHIHEGAGYVFDGTTHFFNASVLNDRYEFRNKPITIDWDSETNEIEFVD